MRKLLIAAAVVATASAVPAAPPLTLTPLGTLKTGNFRSEDPRVAEINAFDPAARRIYVVNPQAGVVDVIDATNPSLLLPLPPVNIVADCQAAMGAGCTVAPGSEPNSVAIHGALMAIAVANAVRTNNGHVVFYTLENSTPELVAIHEAGALPDMVAFSEDGAYAVVANEGEPSADYLSDPPGTVSIIMVARLGSPAAVRHVGFERFDNPGQRAKLEREGVRIFGPGATVSQDLEPEYVAIQKNKAYVTLQENNALAVINLLGATVEKIVGLGRKDYSLPGNTLDPSDQDGGIHMANWPVSGLYQPDAIHAFSVKGKTYLITADEGDAREYDGFAEVVRLNNAGYLLDPTAFPDAAALKANTALGRLNVTTASGDVDGDGDFDRIDTFGGRSISIRDQQGRLVWTSGDVLERLSRDLDGTVTIFNTTSTANSRDNRSDDKSIEPESVAVGEIGGTPYAFVGLERDSGIVVFDLSNPESPAYVTYVNRRKFPRHPVTNALLACSNTVDCGDLGPEGLTFVPAAESPTGKALLIVSNEVSSTTTVWTVE
jgi:2',3'-cyclic-nucleotide 2'-phosphodiesterase/3'-nucleotidase/5'-nucleotidase